MLSKDHSVPMPCKMLGETYDSTHDYVIFLSKKLQWGF